MRNHTWDRCTIYPLGEILGIDQTNISKMELGKRSIRKALAKKLANFFKTDYHLFL
ncbi:MAG: helix-turn-helix domain-containing protein [Chlamydiales bacterium]